MFLSGCYISWSPDGKKILFAASWKGVFADGLYLANSDGTGIQKISARYERVAYPSFLSDTTICYLSGRLDLKTTSKNHLLNIILTTLDLKSHEKKDLATVLSVEDSVEMLQPMQLFICCAPSPDGKWIIYGNAEVEKDKSGQSTNVAQAVWLLNVKSGEARQMTDKGERPMFPIWAPDSKRFAYCAPFNPKEMFDAAEGQPLKKRPVELWVMDIEGNKRKVSDFEKSGLAGVTSHVAWSPDGAKLAYVTAPLRKKGDENGPMKPNLYVLTLETGKEELLFEEVETSNPRWSPDGTMIVTEVFGENERKLCLFDLSAHSRTTFKGNFPVWRNDSKRIAYWSADEDGIAVVDPHDVNSRQVIFTSFEKRRREVGEYLQKGDYRKAVAEMEEIMKLQDNPTDFSHILRIYQNAGKFKEGALWGEKNIACIRSLNDWLAMGEIYAQARMYDKAIKVFRETYNTNKDRDGGTNTFAKSAKQNLDFIGGTRRSALDQYFAVYNTPDMYNSSPESLGRYKEKADKYSKILEQYPNEQLLREKIEVQMKYLENKIKDIQEVLKRKPQ